MAERYASVEAKSELAMDLTEMALCRIRSVMEALLEGFDGGDQSSSGRRRRGAIPMMRATGMTARAARGTT